VSPSADDVARVKSAVAALGEHFDTVQIFVTRSEPDGETVTVQLGSGNWCAREGFVREWLVRQDERARQRIRREEEP
jgi:hypothetical protein